MGSSLRHTGLLWCTGVSDTSGNEIEIQHARVTLVEPEIFVAKFAPDCMTHACRCKDEGDLLKLDACCQHGADVDLGEKNVILARAREIAQVLSPAFRDPARWFDESEPEEDPDFP